MIKKLSTGIIGFGCYIPKFRIKTEELASANNANADAIKNGLLIHEKTLPGKDEDTITIAVAATKNALLRAGANNTNFSVNKIKAVYVGSESHPYAVKPSSGVVGEAIGIGNDFTAADTEFACKAGTAAMQMICGLTEAEMIEYGLAIGADTSQAAPGDALEYSAAAGGAAFIIGKDKCDGNNNTDDKEKNANNTKKQVCARILYTSSKTTDTPDFWRRPNQEYPSHTGRFTGEEAYFKHILLATESILEETGMKITDFNHVVFHQPNGKFPIAVAKKLGVTPEQMRHGLVVNMIGNTYSGSSMLGLVNVLENAKPNEKILLTSYGSGSGSDSFIIETTELITEKQNKATKLSEYLANKTYVNYNQYRKHMEMIH